MEILETGRFVDRLKIPYIGPTLGGVESIVQQPAALFSLDPVERRLSGLKDNLIRYAVGIEIGRRSHRRPAASTGGGEVVAMIVHKFGGTSIGDSPDGECGGYYSSTTRRGGVWRLEDR